MNINYELNEIHERDEYFIKRLFEMLERFDPEKPSFSSDGTIWFYTINKSLLFYRDLSIYGLYYEYRLITFFCFT